MRRRTRRTRLRPGPFIVIGLVVNLAAGAIYSPVTAIRRVRVEGAPEADRARLIQLLQPLRGVPCLRVNPRVFESAALQNPELRSATLSRSPFGSAVLRVARRIAVARLFARPNIGLTTQGVLYAASELPGGLPLVKLPDDTPVIGLTLGNGWRGADVAELAELVRDIPSRETVRIDIERGGRVCLNIGNGIVDLGPCRGLEAKVARLSSILRERPTLFVTVEKLNLVDVDAPTFKPRKGPTEP